MSPYRRVAVATVTLVILSTLVACGRVPGGAGIASGVATTTPMASGVETPSGALAPTSQAAPAPRSLPAIAYDGASGQLLMFGGLDEAAARVLGDTLIGGSAGWSTSVQTSAPSNRFGALVCFDEAHRYVVLFGGTSDSKELLSDTWLWNGMNWKSAASGQRPPASFPYAGNMTFDAATGEIVLFGNSGVARSPIQGPATFTWTWSPGGWAQKNPANTPPYRFGAAMAYDGISGKVILYGGYQGDGPDDVMSDTWSWDGSNWSLVAPTNSGPRPGPAYAAYDQRAKQLWLLAIDGQMWAWVNGAWVSHGIYPAVANRLGAAMLYDGAMGKVLLYGGKVQIPSGPLVTETYKNDLLAWDGKGWTQVG